MRLYKIIISVFITLLTTLSTSGATNFSVGFRVSQVLAQTANAQKAQADKLLEQGLQQAQTSEFQAALQSWQQALIIYRQIKNRQGEGKALGNLSFAYYSLGDYAKAIDYEQQYLAIARQIKDRQSEGKALGILGVAYNSLGDYAKAIDYLQQDLAIAKQIQDRQDEGAALGNLGLAYYSLGDYAEAIDYEQQQLAIARQIKDRQSEGAALGGLGLAYYSLGDYAKAIDYEQQWLAIARQIKDRQSEGKALGNLGVAYLSLGDYTKAIDYQQQHLAIARQIKDRRSEGAALGNLGLAYESLGDYAKAIDYEQQHLAIAREIKDRQSEGKVLGNLGNAYEYLGDYAKAIDYQQQHLTIARQIKDRQSEGAALGNLGLAYESLGDYAKAIDYEQQHLAIAREIKDRQSEGIALNNLGLALYKKGNLADSEKTLFQGITVRESLRGKLEDRKKVSIFETQRNTYNILQKVLISENKTDAALEIAERGRARAFVELLTSRLNFKTLQGTPTIQEIKQIAKQQSSTLVQYSIIYDDFKVADKQQSQESELYIWVIKPTGEVTFRKTDLKPLWQKDDTNLAQLVITSRESIGVRGRGGIYVSGKDKPNAPNQFKRLHELLIKPIADLLPKKESDRVIFIPQSSLFLVPFPALQDEGGKYLIEKHTILTSPSIQVLGLTHNHQQNKGSGDALVVGNPTMPYVSEKIGEAPQQLPQLPGAEKEANAIAPLLKTKPLIGKDATKATVLQRLPFARIVHFATHGILDDVQGLNSGIALAPNASSGGKEVNQANEGLLTSQEILDLKLNAELVVLSACDTGRGKITGDGVIGLSRSLISAGTPSVIVSLWAVHDDSTQFLMTKFYQNLRQHTDKATALRKAMLATKLQYGDPYDWAAFTLIGEAQ